MELYILWYCIVCVLIAAVVCGRGWKFWEVLFICIICTPLIGVILYTVKNPRAEDH